MGIDLQTKPTGLRPPVAPVTFIFDESYVREYRLVPPSVVSAKVSEGEASLATGTRVTILSLSAGAATVWVNDRNGHCVAEVVGDEAAKVSDLCRTLQAGLIGTVTSIEPTMSEIKIQVCVDGI